MEPASRKLYGTLLAALLALALIAVSTASGAVDAKGGVRVDLRKTALGRILVGPKGRALYLFVRDKGPRSTCYGACADAWPPLLTDGRPVAGKGVKRGLLGTSKRRDGKFQVTYKRQPLYYFAGDRKAGQTRGQGSGGVWYVVSAPGKKIAKKSQAPVAAPDNSAGSTPAPPPSPTPGYGGYGGYEP